MALERMNHPKEVDAFASCARTFHEWCDSSHTGKSAEQMQREALTQLSKLYAAALDLPGVDFVEGPEPPDQDRHTRERLASNLKPLPFQYYWEVFKATDQENHEPVCGDLFDDFLDICDDLSQGLWLYDHEHYEAAVLNWNQLFGFHWGSHAVSAIHALHSFDPPEEADAL
jgi:hypothetical protein